MTYKLTSVGDRHYTRGQEVEVYTGKHVNHWQKALYLERLKEDVHLVFIEDECKLGQFPDYNIRPLPKPEKLTFTRGQEVVVRCKTSAGCEYWTPGIIIKYHDDVYPYYSVYVDALSHVVLQPENNIQPQQTTEG